MYKLSCKNCGCDREYSSEKGLKKAIKLKRDLCYNCSTISKKLNKVDMQTAISFYRDEMNRQGVSAQRLDTSKFPSNIPKDPYSAYRDKAFQWSMVTNNISFVDKDEAISFYKFEIERQGETAISKLDKSNWPINIPRDPRTFYKDFQWSTVTGKTINRDWVDIEGAILFYKSEVKRQGTNQISSLDKSSWPINIPKSPAKTYVNFKWSDVTGNVKDDSKATRKEIARLILSYGDMIDNFDDTLIVMLLSQITDKVNITKFVATKVKKLVMNIVENNEQGKRKEELEKLANEISETETYANVFNSEDVEDDSSNQSEDIIVVDEEKDDFSDPIDSSIESVKRRAKALSDAAMNDDFSADFKNLMRKNALKHLWYLEFMK